MSLEYAMFVGYPCFHCWDHVRDFTTWTSSSCGLETEIPKWVMWYSEYRCLLCGAMRVLPQGYWPMGGRGYSVEEVWDEEWDELLDGVEVDDE